MIQITKNMETGIPHIDQQHRELCDRINAVLSAGVNAVTREETEKTLRFLSDYVKKHFSDEEKLQQDSHYPDVAAHKAQHQAYILSINQLIKDFELSGPSTKFTLAVNQSVIDWLVKHISTADIAFARFYLRKQ